MFDVKLSIYECLYVICSSSVRDFCFTSSARTFHPLFLIPEDFATTKYFINHIKKGGHLKDICIYTYIYINLPVNAIVRLPHPESGDSQGQETLHIRVTHNI